MSFGNQFRRSFWRFRAYKNYIVKKLPPKLFLRFFQWYCHPRLRQHIEGDLIEVYNQRIVESGERRANREFVVDVLLLCRPGIVRPLERNRNKNVSSMYKSYFKI